ncbi:MAG: PD-(D/E)XK nuclease family protein [bacterium]
MTTEPISPTEEESYWCETAPNIPRVWSSSSLLTLSECPRKFQYSYVEGWTLKGENLDFIFGSFIHRGLETYWRLRCHGESEEESLDRAVSVLLELGTQLPEPSRPNQAGKTRKGLVNALVWYVDYWGPQDDPSEVVLYDSKPAIEMHFEINLPLVNPDGESYIVQGYVDQIRNWQYAHTVWDYKSTNKEPSEYFLDQFDLSLQCAIYTIGMKVLTNEPINMFMADVIGVETRVQGLPELIPVAFFARKPVQLTDDELDEHLKDIQVLIKNNERYAEQNYWPKNTKACRFCDYRDICKKSPNLRKAFLSTDFELDRRTVLNPRRD